MSAGAKGYSPPILPLGDASNKLEEALIDVGDAILHIGDFLHAEREDRGSQDFGALTLAVEKLYAARRGVETVSHSIAEIDIANKAKGAVQ